MDSKDQATKSMLKGHERHSSDSMHHDPAFFDDPSTRLMESYEKKGQLETQESLTQRRNRAFFWASLHGGIICIYFIIFLALWRMLEARYQHGPNLYYCELPTTNLHFKSGLIAYAMADFLTQAPAREALSFERQRFNITDVTLFPLKYLGKPSDAIEEAWEELLERKCLSILLSMLVFLSPCCVFNDGV